MRKTIDYIKLYNINKDNYTNSYDITKNNKNANNVLDIKKQTDHLYMIIIPEGSDTYEDIGDPKVISTNKKENNITLWESTVNGLFKDLNHKKETNDIKFDEKENIKRYKENVLDSELLAFE